MAAKNGHFDDRQAAKIVNFQPIFKSCLYTYALYRALQENVKKKKKK